MRIIYASIKEGDRLICNVMSNGKIIPVDHVVTKSGLDMHGVRLDLNKEVVILGASILEHTPHNFDKKEEMNFSG
ncbi:hypothetical protein J27TS7_11220 [Paenibacillus dendritiformis]|uniref:hypothetical protein n=1 Tax=Paenibacillus dendritiformis TaxID=130049 RepID=UPI001B202C31|nr:hypothetical protein [Paenibacillus dendritiformis]GIO71608.1 hypothetical protein J27TS7_11220 [Paenibacillus dendritiformis]